MIDPDTPKGTTSELDAAWRAPSPRPRTAAVDEQDRAAGGRDARLVSLENGASRHASIELKLGRHRIYAYLRFSVGGKTINRYVCQVDQPTRFENLRQAWTSALERNLLAVAEQVSQGKSEQAGNKNDAGDVHSAIATLSKQLRSNPQGEQAP